MQISWAILLLGTCLPTGEPVERDHSLMRFEFAQIQMGVPFRLTLYADGEDSANKAAEAAYRRVRQLNRQMSDYDPESELMVLCRTAKPGQPMPVSPELLTVLWHAQQLSACTDGAFDVTVGPVVQLWRRARRRKQLPDPDALAEAVQRIGHLNVRIDREAGTVELLKPGMRLDLGGIAKGFAADEALAVLRKNGISRAMVDAGGDISLGDPPPEKEGWRIGVAPLTKPDDPPSRFLLLANCAVATSGDAFQYVEIEGQRFSHIVDPQTGLGLTDRSNVTVIANNGMQADSLASAVSVLGPRRGLELIEKTDGAAALIVQQRDPETKPSDTDCAPRAFVSCRLRCYEAD